MEKLGTHFRIDYRYNSNFDVCIEIDNGKAANIALIHWPSTTTCNVYTCLDEKKSVEELEHMLYKHVDEYIRRFKETHSRDPRVSKDD